jgi:hypothetical protein
MARWDRVDVIPVVVMVVLAAAAAIALFFWLDRTSGVSAAAEKPFDHSNCQYPGRWSNPPGGCDNSDPAVPECIKAATTESAEKACIDRYVAAHEQKDGYVPISEIKAPPTASHEVKSAPQVVNCTEITK